MRKFLSFLIILSALAFLSLAFPKNTSGNCYYWSGCRENGSNPRCNGSCAYGCCGIFGCTCCVCKTPPPCVPNCNCAASTCKGQTCIGNCGISCPGTKNCAEPTPYCNKNCYPCTCTPSQSGGTCNKCCTDYNWQHCTCGCTATTGGGYCNTCPSCRYCSIWMCQTHGAPCTNSTNECTKDCQCQPWGCLASPTPQVPYCDSGGYCSNPGNQTITECGGCGSNGVGGCGTSERYCNIRCNGAICSQKCVYSSSCVNSACSSPKPGNNACGGCTADGHCCSACRRMMAVRTCTNEWGTHDDPDCSTNDSSCGGMCVGPTPPPSTSTPPPGGDSAPGCTIAGSTTITVGSSVSFDALATDDISVSAINFNYSPSSSESWSSAGNCTGISGTSFTCSSNEITFDTVGDYYVTCDVRDSGSNQCSGNPWCTGFTPSATPQHACGGRSDCGASDALLVHVTLPGPWWQVKDSDVTAGGDLTSVISSGCSLPGCNPFFGLVGEGGFPGVPAYGGTTNLTTADVSSLGWLVNSNYSGLKTYDYAYFARLIPPEVTFNEITSSSIEGVALSSGGTATEGVYWYRYSGASTGLDLNITSDVALGDRKVVLMVGSANLNLQGRITLTDGTGFFATYAGKTELGTKGDINVAPTIGGAPGGAPQLEGLYLADGAFHTGAGTIQLHVRGSIASYGGTYLERDLVDDSVAPAEYFEYAPDQVLLLPSKLHVKKYKWQEVAP